MPSATGSRSGHARATGQHEAGASECVSQVGTGATYQQSNDSTGAATDSGLAPISSGGSGATRTECTKPAIANVGVGMAGVSMAWYLQLVGHGALCCAWTPLQRHRRVTAACHCTTSIAVCEARRGLVGYFSSRTELYLCLALAPRTVGSDAACKLLPKA